MKKFIALVMAIIMALSLATVAMAADITADGGSDTGDVKVNVTPFTQDVYSITIAWGTLTFDYAFTGWNGKDYEGRWANNGENTVTVTNDSNVDVSVTAKFGEANAATVDGVTATLTGNEFSLDAAGGENTFTITLTGKPANEEATINVGTVTVTIAKMV